MFYINSWIHLEVICVDTNRLYLGSAFWFLHILFSLSLKTLKQSCCSNIMYLFTPILHASKLRLQITIKWRHPLLQLLPLPLGCFLNPNMYTCKGNFWHDISRYLFSSLTYMVIWWSLTDLSRAWLFEYYRFGCHGSTSGISSQSYQGSFSVHLLLDFWNPIYNLISMRPFYNFLHMSLAFIRGAINYFCSGIFTDTDGVRRPSFNWSSYNSFGLLSCPTF